MSFTRLLKCPAMVQLRTVPLIPAEFIEGLAAPRSRTMGGGSGLQALLQQALLQQGLQAQGVAGGVPQRGVVQHEPD